MKAKTTLRLDETLVHDAAKATGISEKTALIHLGLKRLVQDAAYRRLIDLGGAAPAFRAPARRRQKKTRGR